MIEKIYKIESETCKKSGRVEFALSRPILNNDVKQNLQALLDDYENKRESSSTQELESRIYCILTNSVKNNFDEMLNVIAEENSLFQAYEKKEKWRRNRKRKRKNKDEHSNGKRRRSCLDMTINRKNSCLFTTLYG